MSIEQQIREINRRFYYSKNPLAFATDVLGFEPDAAQARVLDLQVKRAVLCCSRGFGKTEVTAVRQAWQLVTQPQSLSLVVSETAEKAAELVRRVKRWVEKAGVTLERDPLRAHGLMAPNGSRLLPLPQRAGAVRGYPATCVTVDEAAVVSDEVWTALTGTLATTFDSATVWLLSTPGARRGFFYEHYMSHDPDWLKVRVTAEECSRISRKLLEKMRETLSPADYAREFLAEFGVAEESVFDEEKYLRAVKAAVPVMDWETRYAPPAAHWNVGADRVLVGDNVWAPRNGFYVSIDLGQARDHAALAVLEYRVEPLGSCDPMTLRPHCEVKFRLRWLARFPLATSYADIAETVADMVRQNGEMQNRAVIVVDATGVGRGFVDLLRRLKCGAPVQAVQMTGGVFVRQDGGMTNIPKQEIVMALDQALRRERLEIAAGLPLLREFRRELAGFERVRLPSGKWGYSGKAHGTDDLVMAVGMGLAYALVVHRPRSLSTVTAA